MPPVMEEAYGGVRSKEQNLQLDRLPCRRSDEAAG